MAIEFDHVTADVIEANEFPELSREYNVTGVPKTIINDKVTFVGAVPEQSFVAAIQKAAGIDPDDDRGS